MVGLNMEGFVEYEVDGYFFMDEVSSSDSGLPYDIFVTMNDEINTTPYVFCRRAKKDLSDAIIVSIEDTPKCLRGAFSSDEEYIEIASFILLNKDLFLDYWNKRCFSDRFYDEVKMP